MAGEQGGGAAVLLPRAALGLAGPGGRGAALALAARLAAQGGFAVAPERGALRGAALPQGLEVRWARDHRPSGADPSAAAGYPFEGTVEAPELPHSIAGAAEAGEAVGRWLAWGWSPEALSFLEALRREGSPARAGLPLAVLRGGEHLAVPLGDALGVSVLVLDPNPHRRSAAENAASQGLPRASTFLMELGRKQMELANGLARLLDLPLRYTAATWRERVRRLPRLHAAPRPLLQGLQHSVGSLAAANVPAVPAGGLLGPLKACSCRGSREMIGRIYGGSTRRWDTRSPGTPRCVVNPDEPPLVHCAVDRAEEVISGAFQKTVCIWWDMEAVLAGTSGELRLRALHDLSELVLGALHDNNLKAVFVTMSPGGESSWRAGNQASTSISAARGHGSLALSVEHLIEHATPRYRAVVDHCAKHVTYAAVQDLSGLCSVLATCDVLVHHGTALDAELVLISGKPLVITELPRSLDNCGFGAVEAAENDFVAQILVEQNVAVRAGSIGIFSGLLLGRHLRDAVTDERLQEGVQDLVDFCIAKDRGLNANVTAFLSDFRRRQGSASRSGTPEPCPEVAELALDIDENHIAALKSGTLSNREIAASGRGLKAEYQSHTFKMFGLKVQWTSRVGEEVMRFGAVSNRL